jgi:uncharacterized protein
MRKRQYHARMAFWDRITSRGNVEDRRGMPMAVGGSLGVGGVALLLAFTYLSGGDITDVLRNIDPNAIVSEQPAEDPSRYAGEDEYEVFASSVLGSSSDVWSKIFASLGQEYNAPKLVLFRALTQSGCGNASSSVGPHYCTLDKTIYLDETFFEELTERLGAKGGDVAEAYVIAHEVGHHVQNELGTYEKIMNEENDSNQFSINLELQADCFAGIWANSLKDKNILEPGEIGEAMDAAEAVGDDRIQEKVIGQVDPESWTHGSSEQRLEWFTKGYNSGSFSQCNTFK